MGLDFKLTDDEFKELTTVLDPGNTNVVNCVDFIHLFEGPCDANCIVSPLFLLSCVVFSLFYCKIKDLFVDCRSNSLYESQIFSSFNA